MSLMEHRVRHKSGRMHEYRSRKRSHHTCMSNTVTVTNIRDNAHKHNTKNQCRTRAHNYVVRPL